MRSWFIVLFGIILSALILSAIFYSQRMAPTPAGREMGSPAPQLSSPNPLPSGSPAPQTDASKALPVDAAAPVQGATPDLSVDVNGLSKSTVTMNTSAGVIKFKFYPNDAPKTVKRISELIQKGFYNGLTFHRVVPNFVIQGGDPTGTGMGGSGQKLEAEFNSRRHTEGSLAMARSTDPNSADSQFYICLGTYPHLDHNYTVFGQVIQGMDVAKKIKMGDKMVSVGFQ